ncbi:MAG: CoA-binding protein [Chitinophagaceae bacterium]|nr:CoA-binding protein [Chitinophagaceae bacterium]
MRTSENILLLGASPNPGRTSYFATRFLSNKGFNLFAIGNRKGRIDNVEVSDTTIPLEHVDTVTMFLNADRQKKYYDYIFSLNPMRIIFNPGTENPELEQMAKDRNIQVFTGCTIALMANGVV